MKNDPEPGLRARKHARTKLALLDAFVERLASKPLDEVPVREICEAVGVSQPTFFNYFEGKADLLVYFVQLWSVEQGAAAHADLERDGAVAAIRGIYRRTADAFVAHPRIIAEIFAAQAQREAPPRVHEIGLAERLERYADLEGAADLPALGLDSLLPNLIQHAVERGELPATTNTALLFLTLSSVFFGTPIALRPQPEALATAWDAQLDLIFGALASLPPSPRQGAGS